jgi:hypothetical protein
VTSTEVTAAQVPTANNGFKEIKVIAKKTATEGELSAMNCGFLASQPVPPPPMPSANFVMNIPTIAYAIADDEL